MMNITINKFRSVTVSTSKPRLSLYSARKLFTALIIMLASTLGCDAALAADTLDIGSADVIDNIFAPGGGVFSRSRLSADDESWMTFNATTGDNIQITFGSVNTLYVGAAFFDAGDGLNIFDWNNDNIELGTPLKFLTGGATFISGPGGATQYIFIKVLF